MGFAVLHYKSYISCRTQFVQFNEYDSSSKCMVDFRFIVVFVVYQGLMCLKGLESPLFTDDPNQLMEIVNTQLKKFSQTQKKSHFVLFKTKLNRQT